MDSTGEETRLDSMEVRRTNTTLFRRDEERLTERLSIAYGKNTFASGAFLTSGFISELNRLYEFRDDRVVRYLEKHPPLASVLKEAHERIRKYFGQDARVVLDAIKDSEMDDNERLFAFVQTNLSADDALDRLDELYEQWWLDRLSMVQPKMSIDVEFV